MYMLTSGLSGGHNMASLLAVKLQTIIHSAYKLNVYIQNIYLMYPFNVCMCALLYMVQYSTEGFPRTQYDLL